MDELEQLNIWHLRMQSAAVVEDNLLDEEEDMSLANDFADSKVTVKKHELLTAIKNNRESHTARFHKAISAYRVEVVRVLDRTLADVKEGRPFLVGSITSLAMPTEHTREYDTVIRMLEMSVADEVTVSQKQFQQYVLDDWAWKTNFDTVSSSYGC